MQTKQQVPQMKNTLDCKFACSGSTMYGVEYAIAQFSNLKKYTLAGSSLVRGNVLPVACRCHGKALGTRLEREQLARHDPCHWSPRTGKEEDIDAHKGNGSALCGQIGGSGYGSCDGDNILAYAHTDTSQQEEIAATEAFHHPKSS